MKLLQIYFEALEGHKLQTRNLTCFTPTNHNLTLFVSTYVGGDSQLSSQQTLPQY